MILTKRITVQTHISLEALIQGEKLFHSAMSPSFPNLQSTNSGWTKSCYICFLGIPSRSWFIWPYTTSTLAHLALLVTFSIHDLSRHIVCLLFTICPWGIITFRMYMGCRPHCCHWTAYKGLLTGLLLPPYASPPALQAVTNLSNMTYNPGYDNYDPYMSRSLSRRSVGYPGTPYPHQVYPDGLGLSHPGSEVSFYNNYIPFFF